MTSVHFPRDKVVGILNRLRIGRLRNLGSPTGRGNESSLLESVQTFHCAQPKSYSTYSAVLYPDVKATVEWSWPPTFIYCGS